MKSYNLNSLVFSISNYDVVARQFDNLHSLVSLRNFDWRLTPLVDVVCQITPRVMKTFYSLSAAGRVLYNQARDKLRACNDVRLLSALKRQPL